MNTTDLYFSDAYLSHQVRLLRLTSGEQAKVDALFRAMVPELKNKLNNGLTDFSKRRVNAVLKQTEEVIDRYYGMMGGKAGAGLTPIEVEAMKYSTLEDFMSQYAIKKPVLTPTQISNLAKGIDYKDYKNVLGSLKESGEKYIDAYHVAKLDEKATLLKGGIKRGVSWYEREEMVYFFADPDDIRLAVPYLAMKVEGAEGGAVSVTHFRIPVDKDNLKVMQWDGFFNSQMRTYSAFGIEKDIPKGWIVDSKLFQVPSAKDFENRKFVTKKQLTEAWNSAKVTPQAIDYAGLAKAEADFTAKTFTSIGLEASLPSEATLKALVNGSLIEGAPSAKWWAKQSDDLAFKFSNQVRQGVAQNETVQQIVRRVAGSKKLGIPGIMDVSRRNASALVHTSIQQVCADSKLATFKANADVVKGTRFLATFDSHTSQTCMAHSGAEWDLEGNAIKGGFPFEPPPLHFNCRSTLVPITLTFRELGIDMPEVKGTRASDLGQVRSDLTFDEFLSRHSTEYQDDLLGPGRAKLFREKKITMSDLMGQHDRPLSLDALKGK